MATTSYVNAPSRPGLYWARESIAAEWHLVIHVTGEAPFLSCGTLRVKPTVKPVPGAVDLPRQLIFGPEITPPPCQPGQ